MADKSVCMERLVCCTCGGTAMGKQWWNRDTGYGLCSECAKWLSTRTTVEDMEQCYGRPGEHYLIKE